MTSPVADEAAKLVEALEQWVRARSTATGAAASAAFTEHLATGSAECTLCPFCQLLRLLRGSRPEVFGHLLEATTELTAALRAAVADADRPRGRQSAVQHIDVGD